MCVGQRSVQSSVWLFVMLLLRNLIDSMVPRVMLTRVYDGVSANRRPLSSEHPGSLAKRHSFSEVGFPQHRKEAGVARKRSSKCRASIVVYGTALGPGRHAVFFCLLDLLLFVSRWMRRLRVRLCSSLLPSCSYVFQRFFRYFHWSTCDISKSWCLSHHKHTLSVNWLLLLMAIPGPRQ